ncbi:hypothetical protein OAO01_09520 [Oligoflexia bacterium]|nr:hypothetical protein [Oligoflexia bacterium]
MKRKYFTGTNTFTLLCIFALCMTFSDLAFGSVDGEVGAQSTGSANISVIIPALIKISNISNLNLGTFGGAGALQSDDQVCIYSNSSSGNYHVTASGSGTANAFALENGAGKQIAYALKWNDQPSTVGSVTLSSGVASGTQTGANSTSLNCDGSNNANFQVIIAEETLQTESSGVYNGLVTFVVEPD